jgi:hypothetical protein
MYVLASLLSVGCQHVGTQSEHLQCAEVLNELEKSRPTDVFASIDAPLISGEQKDAIQRFLAATEPAIISSDVAIKQLDDKCFLVSIDSAYPIYEAIYVVENFGASEVSVERFTERVE